MLVLMASTSPVGGYRDASTVTSLHTSSSRSAVMSHRSLWQMDGCSLVGQDSAWPMVNPCLQRQCEASCSGHSTDKGHHGVLLCAG